MKVVQSIRAFGRTLRRTLGSGRLMRAARENEAAADRLDAALKEVFKK